MKTLGFFNAFRNKEIPWLIPLVIIIGLGSLVAPPVARLEMDIGLELLFKLRGYRPAPDQLTIITIDKQSSRVLNLPNHPRKWPRRHHATLVDQLTDQGAAVIGFDIIFSEPRLPADDLVFAESMRRNGNVVLFDYLATENLDVVGNRLHIEKRHPPIPIFEQAALAVAPFALPKVPEQIKQAWLFKQGAGSAPTMPVVMLIYRHRESVKPFNSLLREALAALEIEPELPPEQLAFTQPDLAAAAYHQVFREHPGMLPVLRKNIASVSHPGQRQSLESLLSAFSSEDGIVLDFYGPPQSIRTIPYHKILAGEAFDFSHHAILVGYSEHLQPEQKDGFYTVFTDTAGLDISGVEIMATTLGNLLEARTVRPLTLMPKVALILIFSLVTGWFLTLFHGYRVVAAALILAAIYLAAANWLFTTFALWVPVTTPLAIQLPFALLMTLITQFSYAKSQRERLDTAFRRYLPASVADSAINQSYKVLLAKKQKTFAVCLATDMINYTRLAESTSPGDLHERLNSYFKIMFPTVYDNGGLVIDVVGDAMLAIWHEGTNDQITANALHAANTIRLRLNADHQAGLPTRIGLHCGEVSLGSVGGGKHFEFRAVGDVVNTTTRIEQLNKSLGTKLLASGEVMQHHPSASSRYLGQFLLRGKTLPLKIFQVYPESYKFIDEDREAFSQALEHFAAGEFTLAETLFARSIQTQPNQVADFYIKRCQMLSQSPIDDDWKGIVIVK